MSTQLATDLEQRVAASINAERADAGLPALEIEAHLNASAQGHSDWMADTGRFSHTGEDGSHATDRIAGAGFPLEGAWRTAENIAYVSIAGGHVGQITGEPLRYDRIMTFGGLLGAANPTAGANVVAKLRPHLPELLKRK